MPEHLDLKSQIFTELDKICGPETILASNTSSLAVTELAVRAGRPGKLVGTHFFNPAPVQELVEVVRTVVTEPEVIEDVPAVPQPAADPVLGVPRARLRAGPAAGAPGHCRAAGP